MARKLIQTTDSNGRIIRNEFDDGTWESWEYHENGIIKSSKDSDGNEHRFDERYNLIYDKMVGFPPSEYGYDEDNNLIYSKTDDHEEWYDSEFRTIHEKCSEYEEWHDYKSDNSYIRHFKGNDGTESWYEYKDGIEIRSRLDINGTIILTENDERGVAKCEYRKKPNGFDIFTEYDKNGKPIHTRDSNGYEEWMTYQESDDGISIYTKNNLGMEELVSFNKEGKITGYKANVPSPF